MSAQTEKQRPSDGRESRDFLDQLSSLADKNEAAYTRAISIFRNSYSLQSATVNTK
jgi:hypothetical protein